MKSDNSSKGSPRARATIGIAGAGLMGRLLALSLLEKNYEVTLFDRGDSQGSGSCSFAAGGMLSPYCELEGDAKIISLLGIESLLLWPSILQKEKLSVFFQQEGSLVVAHPREQADLRRLQEKQEEKFFVKVEGPSLLALEPELDRRFSSGLFFPHEGQISARQVLEEIGQRLNLLAHEKRISLHFGENILNLAPHHIGTGQGKYSFDMVIDCRGLGSAADIPLLRGVRGELIIVKAPEVNIRRPVRLMHPRYPVYIIPRPGSHFLIGATQIETQDISPIRIRSVLELLSAAYSLHSGFAEGTILETVVQARPALPDHLPLILHGKGLIRVNGLFRHGYLISPQIVRLVEELLETGEAPLSGPFTSLFKKDLSL